MLRRRGIERGARLQFGVMRLGLTSAVLAVAALSLSDTAANVTAKVNSGLAHKLAPWNGTITARLAEQNMALNSAEDSALHALTALRQDPTAVDALNVLGVLAQAQGDTEQARRIFGHSLKLSRRELPARIWAIEEAVSRGDIRSALASYNIALTTSKAAPDVLFPVLASAIAEPRVRSELLKVLIKQPTWSEKFVDYLTTSGADPRTTVRFFREGAGGKLPVDEADRTKVVNALVARGFVEDGWNYFASFRTKAERIRSRDPEFSLRSDAPSVFDWTTVEPSGISASIQRTADGGLFDFFVAPSASGVMLQQMQMLPPGAYRLEGRSTNLPESERARPYWSLACSDGRELSRIAIPASGSARFSGAIRIPQGCPWQMLSLVARSSGSVAGVGGQIEYAIVRSVGRVME